MKFTKEEVLRRLDEEPPLKYTNMNLPDPDGLYFPTITMYRGDVKRFREEYKTLLLVLSYLLKMELEDITPAKLWGAVLEHDTQI